METELQVIKPSKRTVRTSDRRTFRRCLRKWDFMSSLRQNLQRKGTEQNKHFWFGSGIHFAMEDFHGYNQFKDPRRAFYEYTKAHRILPPGVEEDNMYEMGIDMLGHYLNWLQSNGTPYGFETVWLDEEGKEVEPHSLGAYPLVEYSFNIPLDVYVLIDEEGSIVKDITEAFLSWRDGGAMVGQTTAKLFNNLGEGIFYDHKSYGMVRADRIYYHGTIDRIVKDELGRWWLQDFKTAQRMEVEKLDNDDQVNAYLWAAEHIFNREIYGFVYLQMRKKIIPPPRILKNKSLSAAKGQDCLAHEYAEVATDHYGSDNPLDWPGDIQACYNVLLEKETTEGNAYLRWDMLHRTREHMESIHGHIMQEVRMMVKADLPTFPNQTRDCSWDCPIEEFCLSTDRQDHAGMTTFMSDYEQRPRKEDGASVNDFEEWREEIPWPEEGNKMASMDEVHEYNPIMTIDLSDAKERQEEEE